MIKQAVVIVAMLLSVQVLHAHSADPRNRRIAGRHEAPRGESAPVRPEYAVACDATLELSPSRIASLLDLFAGGDGAAVFIIPDDSTGAVQPLVTGLRSRGTYSINLPPHTRVAMVSRDQAQRTVFIGGIRNDTDAWAAFSGSFSAGGAEFFSESAVAERQATASRR